MGTASPMSIYPSPTGAPVAKVATPNAPNRETPPKRTAQTSSRGVGKTTREKPRPRPDPISLRFGQVIPLLARIGIFWGPPGGVLFTAEGPRPFHPQKPRPPHPPIPFLSPRSVAPHRSPPSLASARHSYLSTRPHHQRYLPRSCIC